MDTTVYLLLTVSIVTLQVAIAAMLCPKECTCTPGTVNQNILEVKCQGLTELPLTLPPASTYRLILTGNQITTLSSRSYLLHTDYLDLSNNQIDNVTSRVIGQLVHRIRYLYLHRNNIACLRFTETDLHEHVNLIETSLHDNPWNCQCIRSLLTQWESLTDHSAAITDRDKLSCQDDRYSPIHLIHMDVAASEDSFDQVFLSSKSSIAKLTQRDGFYAFFTTVTILMVLGIALGLLYGCKFRNQERQAGVMQSKEDIEPIL